MDMLSSDLDQSLNYLIRNAFHLNSPHYNCTGVDSYGLGTPRPFIGAYFLIVGVILLMIYIPCLIVILRSDLMQASCYKIMTYLGVMDICCIFTNSVATGFLGIRGATFCSYPIFIFTVGAFGCGCWMGSCATCILLGINRCCDINQNLKIRPIFIGRKFYITLSIPIIYTFYAVFFTKPLLFNSNYMSWFFNPMIPGHPASDYVSLAHSVNNCVVSGATTIIYAYLCVLIFAKSRHFQSETLSKTQTQIFFQSVLICSFNGLAAYIYIYTQFFSVPPEVVLLGQLAWQCAHGSVCIIYITMNKTIRRGLVDMLVPQTVQNKFGNGQNRSAINALGMGPDGRSVFRNQTTTSSGTAF